MKLLKIAVLLLFALGLAMPFVPGSIAQSGAAEAPAGFDNLTNGMVDQATHDADIEVFQERDEVADGLGPVYNAQSCAECHQSPVTGGGSQITELRAGHMGPGNLFVDAAGGSLINDRAIHASLQEYVPDGESVRTFRMSLNTLGDGFVECIADATLVAIANSQPASMRGQIIYVPVLEAPGQTRVGRFGWKNQHASLLSFAGDAYLNEQGITNALFPNENNSMGRSIAAYDTVADPEDEDNDIELFARFMRASKAPSRDEGLSAASDARAGAQLFNQIGCAICHTPSITTAPTGTSLNGGTLIVPEALGNKVIHSFSDYLLHDIGTGDGIVQNGGQSTRNKLRTMPLWGLRTRNRLLHDGSALTKTEAILRHGGEATPITAAFQNLSNGRKNQLLKFLESL